MDMQERYKRPQEYYGKVKDDNFFIYGMHKWTHKNSSLQRARNREIKERKGMERLYQETENQTFTGAQRSGDLRFHSPSIKIDKPIKED